MKQREGTRREPRALVSRKQEVGKGLSQQALCEPSTPPPHRPPQHQLGALGKGHLITLRVWRLEAHSGKECSSWSELWPARVVALFIPPSAALPRCACVCVCARAPPLYEQVP